MRWLVWVAAVLVLLGGLFPIVGLLLQGAMLFKAAGGSDPRAIAELLGGAVIDVLLTLPFSAAAIGLSFWSMKKLREEA